MSSDQYLRIAGHYNSRLAAHGDTAKGADWPNQHDRDTRHDVMLGILDGYGDQDLVLLDFACGTGDLLRHVRAKRISGVRYIGADISSEALAYARTKFPDDLFVEIDVLTAGEEEMSALACDVCVINGLFTVKHNLGQDEMWSFLKQVVERLWTVTRRGLAFNVMSSHVDRRRDDLFHLSYDQAADFLHTLAGRHIAFRADYGLYEYACFAFKEPPVVAPARSVVRRPAVSTGSDVAQTSVADVCRPSLPVARSLLPYIEAIDQKRWYSNWGALNTELQGRLARILRQPDETVVTASNGTDAITAALIALAGRAASADRVCILPSYTFVGTAAAVVNAGYLPHLVDVNPTTMALDPDDLRTNPALARASAVIVVAPYGRAVDAKAWRNFSNVTKIPVIIDAAAGFDTFASGLAVVESGVPVTLSFHATKAFGTGEGGAILCGNETLARACRRALNFGFLGDRVAAIAGVNGKLSEYHAAVGLAELDGWEVKRASFIEVAEKYRRAARRFGLADSVIAETGWASSYVLFRAPEPDAACRVTIALNKAGVGHRLWYGRGLHRHPAFASCPADNLAMTDALTPCVIGLPMSIDLTESDIVHVVSTIASALGKPESPPSSLA